MGLISNFVERWQKKREATAAAKRELAATFSAFVEETRPLAPKATRHPTAALYRHTWKRAVVLEDIAVESSSENNISLYRQFQELANRNYYSVAPKGPYGKVRLSLSGNARQQLKQTELARIAAKEKERSTTSRRLRGVVYLLKSGPNYKIGQTTDFNRRLNELKLQLPDPATVEHQIQTNRPAEIEKYGSITCFLRLAWSTVRDLKKRSAIRNQRQARIWGTSHFS